MNAEIITIGDELLIGQTINTNASWLGERLNAIGIFVKRVTTVGDVHGEILDAFAEAWERCDVVVTSGGLGPTHDDRTRAAVVEFFGTGLVFSEAVLEDIERMFARLNRELLPMNRDQAMTPAGASVMRNRHGTAPGFHFNKDGKHFFVTPGVPWEMRAMAEDYIIPVLLPQSGVSRRMLTLRTTGIPESLLALRLDDLAARFPAVSVAYLPSALGVSVRLTATSREREAAEAAVEAARSFIAERCGEFIFGVDGDTLEAVVGALLVERGMTLATAESCTGGLLGSRITETPGSSRHFDRGVITYSNSSKSELLGIPRDLIVSHGAVSLEAAVAMAEAARLRSGTSCALSITGIAGPDGGTPEKPVGLVWIGLSVAGAAYAHRFFFGEDRGRTRMRAVQAALDLLRRRLLGLPSASAITQNEENRALT